ncbi:MULTISPECIES: alpha/beta hydrolase [unclassified Iodidimonas]|jgi:pimeloyl-ACP methyl ester carboxylesterase|uniref:alpha/beta fold hydrolase n=1 Tax=unclassified Iodidimonas TaxID=2626145 RepID=UPI0024825904|nr:MULTISPECIES: alpha/beta hydrolase [unclassified Iodidimonas]
MWPLRQFKNAQGLRIAYRDQPENIGKPAILCLHGLTRNSLDFSDLANHLRADFRVLAMDVRGRGQSDRDPDPQNYHPGRYVEDTLMLLDDAGLDEVILIGTSMGGLMSMIMGAQIKDRIKAIIINDIGPEIDPKGLDRIRGYVGASTPAKNWDEARAKMQAINGDALPGLDEAAWDRFTRNLCVETDTGIIPDYDPAIANAMQSGEAVPPDLWPLWQGLDGIPILILRGSHSDILAPEVMDKMCRSQQNCRGVTIPDRGHAPLLDEPAALSAIDEFLAVFRAR